MCPWGLFTPRTHHHRCYFPPPPRQVKDFMLAQPEVTKFRWKDTDYYPEKKKKAKKAKKAKASKKDKGEL